MQKWLNRIRVRGTVHDSEQMSGYSYRVPAYPIAPGHQPPAADMSIATEWVVKSLITAPQANAAVKAGTPLAVRGHAWAGEGEVAKVLVSTDFGNQWREADLTPPANKYAWHTWSTQLAFAKRGLLRNLGAGIRPCRQRPAFPPALEPQRLPRQRHSPGAGPGIGVRAGKLRVGQRSLTVQTPHTVIKSYQPVRRYALSHTNRADAAGRQGPYLLHLAHTYSIPRLSLALFSHLSWYSVVDPLVQVDNQLRYNTQPFRKPACSKCNLLRLRPDRPALPSVKG